MRYLSYGRIYLSLCPAVPLSLHTRDLTEIASISCEALCFPFEWVHRVSHSVAAVENCAFINLWGPHTYTYRAHICTRMYRTMHLYLYLAVRCFITFI